MKILVTGFEPSGGGKFSPTLEAVKSLPIMVENSFIVKLGIPFLYHKSISAIIAAIEEHAPEAVVMLGQRSGNAGLTPEFAALNYIDAQIPDDESNRPQNTAVDSSGPAAYITTLPINGMVNLIKKTGVPADVSYTAGITLNNSVMYGVAHYIRMNKLEIISGFIHAPLTPTQSVAEGMHIPSMSVEEIRKGTQASLSAVAIYLEKISSRRDNSIVIVNSSKGTDLTSNTGSISRVGFYSLDTGRGVPAHQSDHN